MSRAFVGPFLSRASNRESAELPPGVLLEPVLVARAVPPARKADARALARVEFLFPLTQLCPSWQRNHHPDVSGEVPVWVESVGQRSMSGCMNHL